MCLRVLRASSATLAVKIFGAFNRKEREERREGRKEVHVSQFSFGNKFTIIW